MANGFEGIAVGNDGEQIVQPSLGFKGIGVETLDKVYIEPQFGLIGILVNLQAGKPKPIIKNVKY